MSFYKCFPLPLHSLWSLHVLAYKCEVTNPRLLKQGLRQPVVLTFGPQATAAGHCQKAGWSMGWVFALTVYTCYIYINYDHILCQLPAMSKAIKEKREKKPYESSPNKEVSCAVTFLRLAIP